MFMLRNVTKYLFGDSNKETLIEIPQGLLYIVRPRSPKGYSELIFPDAVASIRRTGKEFQYQLVVQRAYEEGEEELTDEHGEDNIDDLIDKDEKTFLLDESLRLRSENREGGENVLAWRDLSGDPGDVYEFVCDPSIAGEKLSTFLLAAVHCQYERKYRKSAQKATEQELASFHFDKEEPIPRAGLDDNSTSKPELIQEPVWEPVEEPAREPVRELVQEPVQEPTESTNQTDNQDTSPMLDVFYDQTTKAPKSAMIPESKEVLAREAAELHLFDFHTGEFILQDERVTATVFESGTWEYWLQVTGFEREWLGQPVVEDINPVFNFEYLSFIFNHYAEDGSAYSWLLRFQSQGIEERFQEGVMQALWERLNQTKWSKIKDMERDYVLDAFNELTMEDIQEEEENADAQDKEEEREQKEEEEEAEQEDDGQRSEHYDSDEDQDNVEVRPKDGDINSQLAVGYKHDRSFVVRGSKVDVFKHADGNKLQYSTGIDKIETPQGRRFNPKKVMLHAEDSNMVMQDPNQPNSLYRMDLEYGKIVDEWKVHDDIPVNNFTPENKFSQMTSAQPFLGISKNALYRIDPRLSGQKLVDSDLKQYASKNEFSTMSTTEKGYIAVASNKGDIRMFDRLGINAKTHIPALGEPIYGLDTSADGRWVLATCRTYLLLIDSLQKEGRYEGKLGFERSFPKDAKPQPHRLGLSPAHVAQFQHETKSPIRFTPARFNTGVGSEETSIITATGPFIITWNMRRVLQGRKDPYTIKRYADEIKADNFQFGSDKNLIVALPNEVNMVPKSRLKKPTRESIAGHALRPGRRQSSRLGRNDIVDSPF